MANCFLVLHENFADSDILANFSSTSEDPDFPLENAFNANRRSKVFRTAGYYNVTSSNNTIVFVEGVSADKTATITTGEYTSREDMANAVAAALNAAPSTLSTYSCVNDSSSFFKFKITSDGTGGAFTIKWSDASTTAEDLLGFDSSGDDSGSLEYIGDYVRINSEEEILWDMGISTDPEVFVLIGKRNESITVSFRNI